MAALTPFQKNLFSVIDAAEAQIKACQDEMDRQQCAPAQEDHNVKHARSQLEAAKLYAADLGKKLDEMDRKGSDIPTRVQFIQSTRVDYTCWAIRHLQSRNLPPGDPKKINEAQIRRDLRVHNFGGFDYSEHEAHHVMGTKPRHGIFSIAGEKM